MLRYKTFFHLAKQCHLQILDLINNRGYVVCIHRLKFALHSNLLFVALIFLTFSLEFEKMHLATKIELRHTFHHV